MQYEIRNVYIYLRKSRADMEAEARGEGETLARHKRQLLELAQARNYNVLAIFEEIVSGENIVNRPEMIKLLQTIESNPHKCDGVMVMDIDRLGRGNMQDQGLILDTFKETETMIITPRKIYDLNDEFDEEFSEFEAFMARKEYKMIKKRMQRGRVASIEEGNYISPIPPYGFSIVSNKNGRYLVPKEPEAEIVQLIFSMYADPSANNGSRTIAKHLNDLKIPSQTGKEWSANSVVFMIKNPTYDGKVKWKGKIYKGKHAPLIDPKTYQLALNKMESHYHLPYKQMNPPSNQFAGIAVCGVCGKKLIRRPMGKGAVRIICGNRPDLCDCRSVRMDLFEKRILQMLNQQLKTYAMDIKERNATKKDKKKVVNVAEKKLKNVEKELVDYTKQKNNLHDLLERGVYDIDTFLERSNVISSKLNELSAQKESFQKQLDEEYKNEHTAEIMYPKLKYVLDAYEKVATPEEQNKLLRSVVDHIVYTKTPAQRDDDFSIEIYMLTPSQAEKLKGV